MEGIIVGKAARPPRIIVYGQEKIGKTTLAAAADAPIFIQTEDGADEVGAARFPLAKSLADVAAQIKRLTTEKHDFATVVIDSLDWLENLVHQRVAADAAVPNIEGIGYGKGYVAAEQVWRKVLASLDELRDAGMAVVLLAHSEIKRYDDPSTEPYDRYQLALHKGASALVTEWCDALLFACLDTRVQKADAGFNKEVRRGVTSGKRVLRCQGAPAYVAGNRYGLPETLPLSWPALMDAFAARMASTEETDKKAAE